MSRVTFWNVVYKSGTAHNVRKINTLFDIFSVLVLIIYMFV